MFCLRLRNVGNLNLNRYCHAVKSEIKVHSYRHKRKVPLELRNPLYSSWYTW